MSGWQQGPTIQCPACGHSEELPHGRTRYVAYGCRCEVCTAANTEYATAARNRRIVRLLNDPSLATHGKASTYINWGCRCDECKVAGAKHNARTRARRLAAPSPVGEGTE